MKNEMENTVEKSEEQKPEAAARIGFLAVAVIVPRQPIPKRLAFFNANCKCRRIINLIVREFDRLEYFGM